jgi:serine/threonine-protein kinase RsbW
METSTGQDGWVEKKFRATVEETLAARSWVAQGARSSSLGAERIMELELAVEEALVNVCSYAYPNRDGEFLVRILTGDKIVTVVIEDDGPPFNPLQSERPDLSVPLEERPIGGLGIHLIRQSASELQYQRKNSRNCLTLVFGPASS